MATATAPRKRARKPRQKHLPGMAPPTNKELESLALRFVERREEWSALKQPMINARDLLEAKMKVLGLTKYEFDGNVIEVVKDEKVVVRRKKKATDEDE